LSNRNLPSEKGDYQIAEGANALKTDCEIREGAEADHFPGCISRTEPVFWSNGEEVEKISLEILVVSNQDIKGFILEGQDE